MSNIETETSIQRARHFADYLMLHPDAEGRRAPELAREFGLDATFIGKVLTGLHTRPMSGPTIPWKEIKSFIAAVFAPVLWLLSNSFLFSCITFGIAIAYFLVSTIHFKDGHLMQVSRAAALQGQLGFGWAALAQFISLLVSGNVKSVLKVTAVYGVLVLVLVISLRLITFSETNSPSNLSWAFVLTSILANVLVYFLFSALCASIGAMLRFKREDHLESTWTRQHLLEKLFELQARLECAAKTSPKVTRMMTHPVVSAVNRFSYLLPIGYGIVTGAVALSLGAQLKPQDWSPVYAGVMGCLLLVDSAFYTVIGYSSNSFLEAWAKASLAYATVFLLELLPINGWGWNVLSATEIRTGLVLNGIILFLLATLGFMLSRVDERTGYRGRLEQNDPVALLTEIIRIEWRLKSRHQEVVLISVDVAKSRAMKAECDPLLAEYSFREYQDFLAGIAQSNEGFVYSTAGDGALLAFTHVSHAFRAAREIQTNVSYFNEHVNKMPSKFRLRVGVHMGEVPGDIREVEFNEVIDTVSHVQRVAPIRGIVVTRPVADELKGESLIPLKEPVSGVEVFLAYDPTVTV